MSSSESSLTPQEIAERCLAVSRADDAIVLVEQLSTVNLRWAGNTLTTNGESAELGVTVISVLGMGSGAAAGVLSSSRVGPGDLAELVARSEAAARESGPAPDAQPLVQGDAPDLGWVLPPGRTSSGVLSRFAADLGEVLRSARADGVGRRELFGYAEHEVATTYLASSTGLRRRHELPVGRVELTGKTADWSASAWAGAGTRDFTDIDVVAVDAEVAQGLTWAARKESAPAGRYDVVLPPGAVADLMLTVLESTGARDSAEGRSVFSAPGGGTRLGEQLSPLPVRMWSDPAHPGLETADFETCSSSGDTTSVFDNGLPLTSTDWLSGGQLSNLSGSRYATGLAKLPARPIIGNLLMSADGAGGSTGDLVAGMADGLLLTCLWYIRDVDPQTLLLTGLTRDGVYRVRGGEVVGAVTNFRWNDSPVDLLSRIDAVGATQRTIPREWADYFTLTALPALRVRGFNMSSVSEAL